MKRVVITGTGIVSWIDRKQLRFMGDAAAYAHISLANAIAESGLRPAQVSHPRTGLIMGSGGGSPANQIESADILRSKGIRRVGPYQVTRCMSSTVSHQLLDHVGVQHLGALHRRCRAADPVWPAGCDVCRWR